MTHELWQDSAGAYVLGALPDEERVGFEAHLAGCEQCRDEVGRLGVAVDALAASPEQLEAPPELKGRIMAVVRAEAELLQAAGARADVPEPQVEPRRRRGWFSLRPPVALAGAVATLALGVVAGGLISSGDGGPATRTVVAQVEPRGASVDLEMRGDEAQLVARNLPHPGAERVYQVWLKRPGQDPQATDALFTTGRDGSAAVRVPGSLDGVEAVLVTREPEGGSTVPSEAPVITAPLA